VDQEKKMVKLSVPSINSGWERKVTMKISQTSKRKSSFVLKSALCVHGIAVEPEYPQRLQEISKKGWGTTFWGKENTTNWFHIPLNTPMYSGGKPPVLTKVFIYFHNTTKSRITAVHIYDGARVVQSFDNLNLVGDHAKESDAVNTWWIDPPSEIQHGLSISVNVEFPAQPEESVLPGATTPPRWILFTTAGAEFA
jgi:hypothetical protein